LLQAQLVESIMSLKEVVKSPELLMEFITGEGSNLNELASVENFNIVMIGMMKTLLLSNQELVKSNKRVEELTHRVVTLENSVARLEHDNSQMKVKLHECNVRADNAQGRAMDLEEYSRRNTITLTNLPYTAQNEDLPVKVVQLINDLGLHGDLDTGYISHAHRNMRWGTLPTVPSKDEDDVEKFVKPPTVTVQFVRAMDKDLLMANKSKWKAVHGSGVGKMNILHCMAPSVYAQKQALDKVPEVDYADYRGHIRHFAVKMVDGSWVNNIRTREHLRSERGV